MKFITADIKRRHFYSRPAGQGGMYVRTHCAYANFDRVCSYSLWCSCARAYKRACAWTGIYTCSKCTCVRVCTTTKLIFSRGFAPNGKNEWNKCKNHFNEMKGDVGMSLHEKEGNKKNLHQADNPSLHLCS